MFFSCASGELLGFLFARSGNVLWFVREAAAAATAPYMHAWKKSLMNTKPLLLFPFQLHEDS